MTAALELLSAALDTAGSVVIVGLRQGSPPIQNFFAPADYAGAVAHAMQLSSSGYNAYFATSTFVNEKSRKADNALAVKCFKIDFDIAPDDPKKYPSASAMFAALKEFCKKHTLLRPVIVESGHGYHCYWIMIDALEAARGKIYAEKFKRVCLATGLKIDPTVTGDVARILRVPDTVNYKYPDAPKAVKLLTMVDMHDTEAFVANLDRVYDEVGAKESAGELPVQGVVPGQSLPAHLQNAVLDDVTRNLIAGRPKKFEIIARKSREGEGCAQIRDIVDNQPMQDEPRWRAGLSVAWACEDGPTAVHDMSKNHAGYDPDATLKKAERTAGPYTCSTFAGNWPQHCDGCKHRGKITSPIQLGEFVKKASTGSNIVLAMNKNVNEAPVPYTIPEYPFPYFRSEGGGVYRRVEDDPEGGELICPKDFYLVERLRDEVDGYIMHLRMHHAMDGVIDFMINTAEMGDKLREHLNKHGLLVHGKEVEQMRRYINAWYSILEQRKEVATVKTQFGWTEGFKSFIIGDREITAWQTEKYSPAAPSLAPLTKLYEKKGTEEAWRRTFNVYARPGMEQHAFCALVGFASPLMALTPYRGVLVNAFSEETGSGKSTTLEMALSIWGEPLGLMLSYKDTAAARFHRMGVYKNMPICVDEVTKMPANDMADFLFVSSQGRGKHRLASSANIERINSTTWASIILCSSNKSFVEDFQADQTGVQGELARMLEPEFPNKPLMSKEEADEIFRPLHENYGHAGERFIKHVMENLDYVRAMMVEVQKRIDMEGRLVGPERFWSALCACIVVGGRIAQECGLHDIDMEGIHKYCLRLIEQTRARNRFTASRESKDDLLSEFCHLNSANTLVVKVDTARGVFTVLEHHKSALKVRYESNLDMVYVTQTEFRKFLRERNVHLESYLDRMRALGKLVFEKQKRMAAGTDFPQDPTRVYGFKMEGGLE
jgi:hypothetical protein